MTRLRGSEAPSGEAVTAVFAEMPFACGTSAFRVISMETDAPGRRKPSQRKAASVVTHQLQAGDGGLRPAVFLRLAQARVWLHPWGLQTALLPGSALTFTLQARQGVPCPCLLAVEVRVSASTAWMRPSVRRF